MKAFTNQGVVVQVVTLTYQRSIDIKTDMLSGDMVLGGKTMAGIVIFLN